MDEATGLCLGCRRTMEEIIDWPMLTAVEKRDVLGRLALRDGKERQ